MIKNNRNFHNRHAVRKPVVSLLFACFVLLFIGCTTQTETVGPASDLPACHIIYDAGSKATRLYVYEQAADGWLKHYGPRRNALADPVRGIRGKTMADVDELVNDMVSALDEMRGDGFVNKKGKTKWPAFDWQTKCNIETAAVYATAGMRLAEQDDAAGSTELWKKLNDKLSNRLGMPVITRTITGYEEGLYAWLAIREDQEDGGFGIAEMGGASVQVAFPCPNCDATRQVWVKGRNTAIASYSFLGWGQDEAWKSFGSSPACVRGAGKIYPDWNVADCAASIKVSSAVSDEINAYVSSADELLWYRTGAFRYMKNSDVDRFCREGKDSGFEPKSSCFRAVYLEHVLKTLGVPAGSFKSDLDWTLGAVVCTDTRCLETQ